MEYALKISGYVVGDSRSVSPNWDRYARDIAVSLGKTSSKEFKEASQFYLNNAPLKQALISGNLEWVQALPTTGCEINNLFILVRRVRNNLFHGGKYNTQIQEETARNETLLQYGVVILMESIQHSNNVHLAYQSASI